jgi:hypothetical protein
VITVLKLLDMTVITKIPNLVRRNVKQGIKSQLDSIKSKGFVVKSKTTDGGFACLKEWTNSRADSHVPEVENKIRTLKNRI